MPRFNWRALFDSLYDTRVYDNTLSHVFRIVRCFFRYIITKQPFDSTNEMTTPAVASAIDELMKLRKKRDKKNNNNGNEPVQEESSDATFHSPETSNYTFSVVWEKTDTSKHSVYVEILQKLMNLLNCICLVYNGSFANLGGADNMRVFSVRELQSAVKKQQGVWNKDRILSVYGEIFNSFDIDAFIGSCCRPRVNTFPSKIIGNRFASVPTSDVNLNFLRVASEGVCSQIIWNLCTRRYEVAAPSLLYLLSLDTSNWNVTEAESYPNARDPRTAEYTSLILLHMDEFLSVAQRADALSMMLYSRLISKKRVGDSDGKDVVLAKVATISEQPEDEEAREETAATLPCESSEPDDAPRTPSINYVDFVIDRAEFLRLAQHVPTVWIYAFVRHTLQCAPTGDRGSTFFLQMVLLMIQLRRDPQFAPTLESGTTFLVKALIDETLESTVPLSWLRKRKRESGGTETEPVADKRSLEEVSECTTYVMGHVTQDALLQDATVVQSENSSLIPFDRFVEKQLSRINVNVIDERFVGSSGMQPVRESFDSVAESSSSSGGGSKSASGETSMLNSMWHVFVKDGKVGSERRKEESSFVRNILVDRDFRMRIRSLLRDAAFNKWSLEAISTLDETLVHQLSDVSIRSLFFAYVYTVRFLTELPALDAPPATDPSMGWELRVRSNDLLDRLLAFFPCRFTVNTKTMDVASAMTTWLEDRMTPSSERPEDEATACSDENEEFVDFNELMSIFKSSSGHVGPRVVSDESSARPSQEENALYCVHDVRSLPRSVRESITYHCLVVHIFCDLDLIVSIYMLRLLLSFLFPGVENRTSVIVRGSSGSGKSQFFDMIREFYNCASNGIISTQALACGRNVINTEMMPIGENLLCQIDEPKRVDNETFKLSISLVPIPTRSFSNQIAQSIPVLAKLVFTVNNMFQIESDDGILERLHCVFRLSHKHYNLVNEQTDMTRYNSGASYNIAHQFTDRIFPRDVDRASFSRGLFHVLHHWSVDQTSRPDVSYFLADHMSSFILRCVLNVNVAMVEDPEVPFATHVREEIARCALQTDLMPAVKNLSLIYEKVSDNLLRQNNKVRTRIRFAIDKKRENVLPSLLIIDNVLSNKSLTNLLHSNIVFSVSRWRRVSLETDFAFLLSDSARCEHVKRQFSFYTRAERLAALLMADDVLPVFTDAFAKQCREYRNVAISSAEHLSLRIVSEFDADVRVDISTLPSTLDMHLLDLQMSIDSFVRFKRTFSVEYSPVPISGDVLRKQLATFVNEVNTTIDDAKYRVKLKDFFDRFETEYGKLRYRRPDTNQVVSNAWSVRLRRLY